MELVQRQESSKKLQELGRMLLIYINDHNGKYPDSLDEIETYDSDRLLAWSLENVEYLGKGIVAPRTPQAVIAYDKRLLGKTGSTNILFNNTHVQYCKPDRLEKLGITSD